MDCPAKQDVNDVLDDAAASGNTAELEALLDSGVTINDFDDHLLQCALDITIMHGYQELLVTLLDAGADPDAITSDGWPMMDLAVTDGNPEAIKALLAAGADPYIENHFGGNLLHIAATANATEVVPLLVDAGVCLTALDQSDYSPLAIAARGGSTRTAEALIKAGAPVDSPAPGGLRPLAAAVGSNSIEMIDLLVAAGAELNKRHATKQRGPFLEGQTYEQAVLHIAARDSQAATVKHLLAIGADVHVVDSVNQTPLHVACGANQFFLEHVPLNNDEVWWEVTEIIRLLVAAEADVNAKDSLNGSTPLHIAVQRCVPDTVELLLDAGAEINALDNEDSTPLHICLRFGRLEVLEMLLEAGADVNSLDHYGETPIGFAARYSEFDIREGVNVVELMEQYR